MNLILFDDPVIRLSLLPFTYTRPTSLVRVGILTIREKWEKRLNLSASFKTADYLQQKFQVRSSEDNLLINGAVCPDEKLVNAIKALQSGHYLVKGSRLIAALKPEHAMASDNTVE